MNKDKFCPYEQDQQMKTFQQSRAVNIFQKEILKQLKDKQSQIQQNFTKNHKKLQQKTKAFIQQLEKQLQNKQTFWISKIENLFTKLKHKLNQQIYQFVQKTKNEQKAFISQQKRKLQESIQILEYEMIFSEMLDQQNRSKIHEFSKAKDKKTQILTEYLNGTLQEDIQKRINQINQACDSKLINMSWEFNDSPLQKFFELAEQIYLSQKSKQIFMSSNLSKIKFQHQSPSKRINQLNKKTFLPQFSQKNSSQFQNKSKQTQSKNTTQKILNKQDEYELQNQSRKYKVRKLQTKYKSYNNELNRVQGQKDKKLNPFESIEEYKKQNTERYGKRKIYKSHSKIKQNQISQNFNNLIVLSQKKKLLLQHLQFL